jgi:hypothetical protein
MASLCIEFSAAESGYCGNQSLKLLPTFAGEITAYQLGSSTEARNRIRERAGMSCKSAGLQICTVNLNPPSSHERQELSFSGRLARCAISTERELMTDEGDDKTANDSSTDKLGNMNQGIFYFLGHVLSGMAGAITVILLWPNDRDSRRATDTARRTENQDEN